jgi:hypothetical protein
VYLLTEDKPVLLGDIFAAGWLNDAWLENDAKRLGLFTAKGGFDAYGNHAATESEDFLLAHGRMPQAAILLNDDCYIETVLVRYGTGRLVFAPVFGLPAAAAERTKQLNTRSYSRLPLPPATEFAGGVADLRCTFGVAVKSKAAANSLVKKRLVRLDPHGRKLLEARWGAHAARRGPVVARTAGDKLADMLAHDQGEEAKRALERLLAHTWSAEGAIPDLIDIAAEDGTPAPELVALILERVEAVEREAQSAGTTLRELAALLA